VEGPSRSEVTHSSSQLSVVRLLGPVQAPLVAADCASRMSSGAAFKRDGLPLNRIQQVDLLQISGEMFTLRKSRAVMGRGRTAASFLSGIAQCCLDHAGERERRNQLA